MAIVYSYEREADHLNLAPTTSATLTMVIEMPCHNPIHPKEFDRKDFYLYHPGGSPEPAGTRTVEVKMYEETTYLGYWQFHDGPGSEDPRAPQEGETVIGTSFNRFRVARALTSVARRLALR